jgi:hypothetical protein
MSEADEGFLARWARRKRQAAEQKRAPQPTEQATGEHVPEAQAESGRSHPGTAEAARPALPGDADAAPFDVSKLPSLESITADTDIAAFLGPGVPAELTRAALRRAWVADPKIRDFVGIAENQWDFTVPGGAPGFGPLESTEEIRRLAARIVGDWSEREPVASPATEKEYQDIPGDSAETASTAEVENTALARPEEQAAIVTIDTVEQNQSQFAAAQHKQIPTLPKPRSGGALPR